MKTRTLLYSFVLFLAFFLTACGPQDIPAVSTSEEKELMSDTSSEIMDENDGEMTASKDDAMPEDTGGEISDHVGDEMMEEKTNEDMEDDYAMMGDSDDDMMDNDDAMMDDQEDEMSDDAILMTPDWFKAVLTDVKTGETFKVADLKGKVTLVETLAMWCSNCLKQQEQVKRLHDLVGDRADYISLGLDIDPNENADALKSYIGKNGFNWIYAVAPTEVSREIGQLYGDQFLNPPSTPMLIIDREGEVHLLPFGIKSAEDLLEALQPFFDAGM